MLGRGKQVFYGSWVYLMIREAPIRACFSGAPRKYNFEIKAIDGTANPYLALAAILAAGMLGVKISSPLTVKSCVRMSC